MKLRKKTNGVRILIVNQGISIGIKLNCLMCHFIKMNDRFTVYSVNETALNTHFHQISKVLNAD
jgi:hypothetical protein